MKIAIIKYNAGNIMSVDFALRRLGVEAVVTDNFEEIIKADKVIFPGVGEASSTMAYLKEHKLDVLICNLKQPVLGICLGLQLMCSHTEEGNVDCLSIFPERVKKFVPKLGNEFIDKVPHIGWNSINALKTSMFDIALEGEFVYFVHSYYAAVGADTAAICDYINPFSAALQRDNFYAMQFHPEKSGAVGAKMLERFLMV